MNKKQTSKKVASIASGILRDGRTSSKSKTREFDTLKSKKVPQSLEIGLFFCQIFIFII